MAIGCLTAYTADLTSSDYPHDSDNALQGGGFLDARNASDNDTATYIQTLTYCSIDFGAGNEKTIRSLHLWAWNIQAHNNFKQGLFQGSHNDASWDTLADLSLLGEAEGGYPDWIETLEFDNNTSYRYYRLFSLPNNANTILAEWQLKACEAPTHLLSGTVKESGVGVARQVRSYIRSTGVLYSSTTSESNGTFELPAPDGTTLMFVIAFDDDAGNQYNALIYDKLTGVAT